MMIQEDLLHPIKDDNVGFTQVDHQLTKVIEEGESI
jgi:hypothetical protein